MGNEASGMGRTGDPRLDLLLNLAQMEAQLRGVSTDDDDAHKHAWDPKDCSDNLRVSADHSEVTRGGGSMGSGLLTLVGQTDVVRGKRGYLDGIHMWEIHWPQSQRGSHAVIGVATEHSPIKCVGYKSLLGADDQSLGWDITHNAALYNSVVFSKYPDDCTDSFKAPDTVLVILNLNEGTLSFKNPSSGQNYGLCLSGLGLFKRNRKRLYPAVSMTKNGATVKIKYIGDSQSHRAVIAAPRVDTYKPISFPSGNYTFHRNSGGNITLSNGNKTATRHNGLDEGVVLTSSPLKPNTLFEVRLDKKQGEHPLLRFSNSIEIGVTSNNPATLRLPDTMTDLKYGKSWMISGSKLAYNGQELQTFSKLDLNRLEQGTLIGMAITQERQLQVFLNGELKAKCNLDIPQTVYGVIDVYGRAEKVTIIDRKAGGTGQGAAAQQGKSKADLVMDGLKLAIAKMREKKPNGVTEVAAIVTEKINQVYVELGDPSHQTLLIDKFSEMGGGEAVAGYVEFLIKRGRETDDVNKCFIIIQMLLLNATHASLLFASKLGKTGIFKLMMIDIKRFLPRYMDSQNVAKKLVYWLAILHNCSKATENRDPLRSVESTKVLKDILDRNNDISFQVLALAGLVNIFFDHETKQLRIKETLLDKLIHHLKDAVSKSSGNINSVVNFTPADEGFNFYALELTVCIQAVAPNQTAGNYLVRNGICEALFEQLDKGNRNDREIALGALWQLANPQTVERMMKLPNIMGKLRQMKDLGEEEVGQAATRLQVKLNELATKKPTSSVAGQRMPAQAPTDCEYRRHCMSFFKTLELDDAFLEGGFSTCFCASCHAKKGDELYYTRGEPRQTYGLPIGWFRIGLKAPPKAAAHKAFDKWHRCYHGTKADNVKKILECGDILLPGDTALGGHKLGEREGHFTDKWKPEGFDTKQIFVSPSIRYAGHNAYATPSKFEDKQNKKVFTSRVAFQILIKPGSYIIGKETVGAKTQIDPKFSNQELEWSTKERGAVIIYGLLIKLDEDRTKASFRESIFSGAGATGN